MEDWVLPPHPERWPVRSRLCAAKHGGEMWVAGRHCGARAPLDLWKRTHLFREWGAMSEQPGLLGGRHPRVDAGNRCRRPGEPRGDLRGLLLDCVAQAVRPQWSWWCILASLPRADQASPVSTPPQAAVQPGWPPSAVGVPPPPPSWSCWRSPPPTCRPGRPCGSCPVLGWWRRQPIQCGGNKRVHWMGARAPRWWSSSSAHSGNGAVVESGRRPLPLSVRCLCGPHVRTLSYFIVPELEEIVNHRCTLGDLSCWMAAASEIQGVDRNEWSPAVPLLPLAATRPTCSNFVSCEVGLRLNHGVSL